MQKGRLKTSSIIQDLKDYLEAILEATKFIIFYNVNKDSEASFSLGKASESIPGSASGYRVGI